MISESPCPFKSGVTRSTRKRRAAMFPLRVIASFLEMHDGNGWRRQRRTREPAPPNLSGLAAAHGNPGSEVFLGQSFDSAVQERDRAKAQQDNRGRFRDLRPGQEETEAILLHDARFPAALP